MAASVRFFASLAAGAALMALVATAPGMTLASGGKARCVIVVDHDAPVPERHAAEELATHLKRVTGALFTIQLGAPKPKQAAILVGAGDAAHGTFPEVDPKVLGNEQVVMKLKGNRLLLAGGRPRGTLYAVYRFLYEQCGVRWWTPWAATIPQRKSLTIGALDKTEKPAFEARDPFWYAAFDGDWAARNYSNSQSARLDAEHGGKVTYKGFVHTFYGLVPPDKYFKDHPEWYSLIDGKRTFNGAQLCTTNQQLRDFMVGQVRAWLKESPNTNIISISQNDCWGPCQCPNCKAIDDAEGSYSGTMVSLVNYIADKLGPDFPDVAFDTLAYQYTRKAPKTVKPRPNVIVRLCSIECNFDEPLTGKSNEAFAKDIVDWNRLCNRLYVWDYTTNFAHYVQPHPNWFAEGPNIRFFRDHGVKGLFEEGAYQSNGSEMAELRAWVEAQLMWNPDQDDKKLIDEFLLGYYGRAAAKPIREYMNLLSEKAKGYYMGCYSGPDAPFLDLATLSQAEKLWQRAEAATQDPDLLWRVKMGHLPLYYVWLQRWVPLRRECLKAKAEWPLATSRKAVADQFAALCADKGPQGWKPVSVINEGSWKPVDFVARYQEDPPDPRIPVLPERKKDVGPPPGLATVSAAECIDMQDNLAPPIREGEWMEMRADPLASDGIAVWMPTTHHEWAFHIAFKAAPASLGKKWKVYAVVRSDRALGAKGTIMTAGVYDEGDRKGLAEVAVQATDLNGSYRAILIGTVDATANRYVWVAPAQAEGATAIWVDRIYLVPAL